MPSKCFETRIPTQDENCGSCDSKASGGPQVTEDHQRPSPSKIETGKTVSSPEGVRFQLAFNV